MRNLIILGLIFYSALAFGQVQFKSGKSGFASFLKDNTVYPSYSRDNCIQGTVNISFKLDENGKVYYSRVSKGILTELDDEALRLVRLSSGKWKVPAGYDTTISIIAPVNFQLAGYCDGKTNEDIQAAIRAYQNEEALTNSVINFYKNIDQAKPGQEVQIIAIKNQLGIDDEYLESRIKNGLKKIKQGDNQGACEEFLFVKYMGSKLADQYLEKYCK